MAAGVEDRDKGLKRIMENARRRFPRVYTVGTHNPKIAAYAVIQEMRTRFMRDAFDKRVTTKLDTDLGRLADAIAQGQDPKPEQLRTAEGFGVDYRKAITGEQLIDTGALRDSIDVEEQDG